jgi:hypothetical protein
LKFNLGGVGISDEKSPKTGILDRFFTYSKINIALIDKSSPTKLCLLIIQVMLKFKFISKYNLRGVGISVLA